MCTYIVLLCVGRLLIVCVVHSIQYMRHLHDKVKVLDERTAPPKVEEVEANEIANGIIASNMINTQLLLGDVNGSTYGTH